MIIWGSRANRSTLGKGRFTCPRCQTAQGYEKLKLQRYFTLYFIPLFPMGASTEYVECQLCKAAFEPRILMSRAVETEPASASPGDAVAEELRRALLRTGAWVITRMGGDANATDEGAKALGRLGIFFSVEELSKEVQTIQSGGRDVPLYLRNFGKHLDANQKARIVEAAEKVAVAAQLTTEESQKIKAEIEGSLGTAAASA